jgi:hypothetical protein
MRMAQTTLMQFGLGGPIGALSGIAGFFLTTSAVTDFSMSIGG